MTIASLALANLRRHKLRGAVLVAGLGLGVAAVVALFSLSRALADEIGRQMDQYGANIIVTPQAGSLALDYGGMAVTGVSYDIQQVTDADVARIRAIPLHDRLSAVAPQLLGTVQTQGRPVVLGGVDFAGEMKLKRWWRVLGRVPANDDELLAGYDAALALGVIDPTDIPAAYLDAHGTHAPTSANTTTDILDPAAFVIPHYMMTLNGQEFKVTGILAPTGGRDDERLFATLPKAQALLNRPGQVSLVEISALCQNCPIETILAQIRTALPEAKATAVQQSLHERFETVAQLERFGAAVLAVAAVLGGLLIGATTMGAVAGRTREIGVWRALGFRRRHIMEEILLETALLAAVGGLAGWGAGVFAGWVALPHFAKDAPAAPLELWLPAVAVGATVALGLLGSLYPALRAARLDPVEALRSV